MIRALLLICAVALIGGCDDGEADICAGGALVDCGEPCAPGNDFGVGMACTPGGGECADTPGRMAPICTVDFEAEADAFCTRPCDPDMEVVAQCGINAICRGEDAGGGGPTGCVPMTCVD